MTTRCRVFQQTDSATKGNSTFADVAKTALAFMRDLNFCSLGKDFALNEREKTG
jgi:hypothetical protein